MTQYTSSPKSLTLQLHITENCNWRCKHCYQDDNSEKREMQFHEMEIVIGQYKSLLKKWGIKKEKARINIVGGEPLLNKDFFKLSELLCKNKDKFEWSIFSNGSMINEIIAKKLKAHNLHSCQISIEGCKKINDSIRGEGSYGKIIKAIKILLANDIVVKTSLTLSKKNLKDIPKLTNILNSLGVSCLNTRRLVPLGRGNQYSNEILNKEEQNNFYNWTENINKDFVQKKQKLRIKIGCDSGIFNKKKSPNSPTLRNFCAVMNGSLLVIMPNGDVMPCRRLPVVIGNIFHSEIYKIWSNESLKKIRNVQNSHIKCKKCNNFELCFGGAKCISYAVTQDFFSPDSLCL